MAKFPVDAPNPELQKTSFWRFTEKHKLDNSAEYGGRRLRFVAS
jgi:hypothetical protein